jgi:hypothetical protein
MGESVLIIGGIVAIVFCIKSMESSNRYNHPSKPKFNYKITPKDIYEYESHVIKIINDQPRGTKIIKLSNYDLARDLNMCEDFIMAISYKSSYPLRFIYYDIEDCSMLGDNVYMELQ